MHRGPFTAKASGSAIRCRSVILRIRSSDKRKVSFRDQSVTSVGILRSTGITRLPRYYDPIRFPPCRPHGYVFPCRRSGYQPQQDGPPRFLDRSIAARHPLSPRGAGSMPMSVASRPVLASSSLADWPLPLSCNEAGTGSLALRLTASPSEASNASLLSTPARSATCLTDNLHGRLLSSC